MTSEDEGRVKVHTSELADNGTYQSWNRAWYSKMGTREGGQAQKYMNNIHILQFFTCHRYRMGRYMTKSTLGLKRINLKTQNHVRLQQNC